MSLVGTHSINVFTSPVNSAGGVNANLVRGNDNVLRNAYVAHDADATIHVQSSTLAARPAAGVAGRKWMTVDGTAVRFWYDTGSTWLEVSYGDVVGPASATDNAVARFDGTSGKVIQNSAVTVQDDGRTVINSGAAVPALTTVTTGTVNQRWEHDSSNYLQVNVQSTGNVIWTNVGTSPAHGFSAPFSVQISSRPTVTNAFNVSMSADAASTLSTTGQIVSSIANHAAGTMPSLTGAFAQTSMNGAGTVTTLRGLRTAILRSAGTVTDGVSVDIDAIANTMTNAYGLRIGNVTGGSSLNYAIYTNSGLVRFGDTVNTTSVYQVNGTQVVGAQGAAVSDPTGGTVQDSEARTAINAIIDRLQAHGLIA